METPIEEPRDEEQENTENLEDLEPADAEGADVTGGITARIDKLPRS